MLAADHGATEPLVGVPLAPAGCVPHLHVLPGEDGEPLIGLVPLAVTAIDNIVTKESYYEPHLFGFPPTLFTLNVSPFLHL